MPFSFCPAGESQTAPKITICMAVYNIEKYLPACLESVAAQTFRDFELIAVDDGSTDRSWEILTEFAKTHPFLRVIRQENQGLSAVRNRMIPLARGEYLCFLDGDDCLLPNYLEELYREAVRTGADITCCGFFYWFPKSGRRFLHPFRRQGVLSGSDALHLLLHDWYLQSFAWNKLFRRSLWIEHGLQFPPSQRFFEDISLMPQVFFFAEKVALLREGLYLYAQHSAGLTKSTRPEKINDFIRATVFVRLFLESQGAYGRFRKSYAALCRKTNLSCLSFLLINHWKQRQWKGFLSSLHLCSRRLRESQQAHLPLVWTANPQEIPDVLPASPADFSPRRSSS